jgi:aspartate/methionine/tyrosine aminotransferase
MEFIEEKLGEFFSLGRKLGYDTVNKRWTADVLIDAKGYTPRLGEIMPEWDNNLLLDWSGDHLGPRPLRERIVESQRYAQPPDNVVVTLGTQQANFFAMLTALDRGDEIVVEVPSWMQPQVLARAIGAPVKLIQRREELGWKFDLDELHGLVSTKTKLIYVCNPSNPTGAVLDAKDIDEICRIAGTVGAYVLSDEIYRGLEWEGELTPAVADRYERGISTGSVSKTIAMDGLRVGWLLTPDRDFIRRVLVLKRYNTTPHQSCLDEAVAIRALDARLYPTLLEKSMKVARGNRALVSAWMAKQRAFSWVAPTAGFLSFPKYDFEIDSWSLCTRLLQEPYHTYLIPGSCYGVEYHVRLGFGASTPSERIARGLSKLEQLAHDLRTARVS